MYSVTQDQEFSWNPKPELGFCVGDFLYNLNLELNFNNFIKDDNKMYICKLFYITLIKNIENVF